MVAENPLALAYILPGDVYILPGENLTTALALPDEAPSVTAMPQYEPAPILQAQEPAETYQAPVPQAVTIPAIPKQVVTETPAVTFNYTGGYQNKFLIMVHYPIHTVMDSAHQNALESTIKRKELSLNDVAIVNLSQYPGTDLRTIGGFFKPERMLFLGKEAIPPGLKNPLTLNQITKLGNCNFLYTFSFGEMMGNKENTKAFWEQMKTL